LPSCRQYGSMAMRQCGRQNGNPKVTKRPSLAETMRQVAVSPESAVIAPRKAEPEPATKVAPAPKPFYAATRVGKKKVTATLSPADHKQLKSLAVDRETTTEALLSEAIADLFAKYGRQTAAH